MLKSIQSYIESIGDSKSYIDVFNYEAQTSDFSSTEFINNSILNANHSIYHKLQDGGFQGLLPPAEYKSQIKMAKENHYGFRIINAHFSSDILKCISGSLSIKYNCNTSCNLYYTPRGVKALNKHSDNYDILVIQLEGSKRWFFKNTQALLKQGDAIFIQKGQVHETICEEDSTHLAFSIPKFSIGDLINKSFELQNLSGDINFSDLDKTLDILNKVDFKNYTKRYLKEIYTLYTQQILLTRNTIPPSEKIGFSPGNPFILNFPEVINIQESDEEIKIHTSEKCFEFTRKFEIKVLGEIFNLHLKKYPINNIERTSFLKYLYKNNLIRNLVL